MEMLGPCPNRFYALGGTSKVHGFPRVFGVARLRSRFPERKLNFGRNSSFIATCVNKHPKVTPLQGVGFLGGPEPEEPVFWGCTNEPTAAPNVQRDTPP